MTSLLFHTQHKPLVLLGLLFEKVDKFLFAHAAHGAFQLQKLNVACRTEFGQYVNADSGFRQGAPVQVQQHLPFLFGQRVTGGVCCRVRTKLLPPGFVPQLIAGTAQFIQAHSCSPEFPSSPGKTRSSIMPKPFSRWFHVACPDRATASGRCSSTPVPVRNQDRQLRKIEFRQRQWFQRLLHGRKPAQPPREYLQPLGSSRTHHACGRHPSHVPSHSAEHRETAQATGVPAGDRNGRPGKDDPERNQGAAWPPAGYEAAPAFPAALGLEPPPGSFLTTM